MPAPQKKDFALVVGISDYADQEYLESLKGPNRDVKNFVNWLVSPTGGNIPDAHVDPFKLLSDADRTTPNLSDFYAAVNGLLALSKGGKVQIGRRLYIFMAGHGVGPDVENVGLLTVEATEMMPTYIDGRRFVKLFKGQAIFNEIILIMDCCRDYDSELPEAKIPFKGKVDPGGAYKVKVFYAFGTGFGRAAREREFDGEVSGIFSYVLMKGLLGGAIDGEGRITGGSLQRYVKKHFKKHLPEGIDQDPEIVGPDDLILADGYPPATTTVNLKPSVPHDKVVVKYGDGLKPVEAASQKQADGTYTVKLPIGKTYVFELHDAVGVLLKQAGKAVEDADEVINVDL
jgi:hypothetical protein